MSAPLADGTRVQYRKTGQALIQSHACPPEFPADSDGATTHRYWVLFRTGRYRGQGRLVWVRNDEKISDPEA